jgi:hypothetical protein
MILRLKQKNSKTEPRRYTMSNEANYLACDYVDTLSQ